MRVCLYAGYQAIIFSAQCREIFVKRYLSISTGVRILDLGCGPATFLPYFIDCPYTGVDIDSAAISQSAAKYRDRRDTRFVVESITSVGLAQKLGVNSFDRIVMHGVIHHLSDSDVHIALQLVKQCLAPSGLFVSFDPCFYPRQALITRALLALDRGRYIRTEAEYQALVSNVFTRVTLARENDLLRVPYDLCVIQATDL